MNDLASWRGPPASSAVEACGRDITGPPTMLMDGLFSLMVKRVQSAVWEETGSKYPFGSTDLWFGGLTDGPAS